MPQTNLVPETDAAPETDTVPQADPVPETDAAPETDPASQTDPGPSTPNTDSPIESDLHTRLSHPLLARFVARGTRRRAGYLPSCVAKPVLVPIGDAYLYDQFLKLLAAHPELVDGKHPDGHGGYDEPPPGALTYKPSAETAALVRARDRHCRFPGCQMPAARCQLDHIVPFDHAHPARGGWSTASDLECVCEFHHALKTAGLWHAVALPGMAILWTGPRGDRHLTLPAGGLTPVPAADLHSAGP